MLSSHKDRPYFAVLSVGSQTLTSRRARAGSNEDVTLVWEASAHFILQKDGPTRARVAIYRGGKYKGALNNYLECWCTVDLASFFPGDDGEHETDAPGAQDDGVATEWLDLAAAGPDGLPVHCGRLKISAAASTPRQLESQLWTRLLPLADFDGDGQLTLPEFELLMQAFGAEVAAELVHDLWRAVSGSGPDALDEDCRVPIPRLAEGMARAHARGELSMFMRRCPVDGAILTPGEDLANLLYISLALDRDVAVAPAAVQLKVCWLSVDAWADARISLLQLEADALIP